VYTPAQYSGHTLRSDTCIGAPLISREVLPETHFLFMIKIMLGSWCSIDSSFTIFTVSSIPVLMWNLEKLLISQLRRFLRLRTRFYTCRKLCRGHLLFMGDNDRQPSLTMPLGIAHTCTISHTNSKIWQVNRQIYKVPTCTSGSIMIRLVVKTLAPWLSLSLVLSPIKS
jgi:hypothetical protein